MRKHAPKWQPKGSFPLPDASYATQSKPSKNTDGRKIIVTGKLRAEPDTEKLALVVIEMAKYLAEEERKKNRL